MKKISLEKLKIIKRRKKVIGLILMKSESNDNLRKWFIIIKKKIFNS
jgi:hypothetical protein